MYLREITQSVTRLKGVGSVTAKNLAAMGILAVKDLLLHYPRAYQDRITIRPLSSSADGLPVNTVVKVIAHDYFGWGPRKTLKVWVEDDSARAVLVCFGRNFLANLLTPGSRFRLFAQFQFRFGELQSSTFEVEPADGPSGSFGILVPVYPLSGSLNQAQVRRAMKSAIDGYVKNADDEIPSRLMVRHSLMSKAAAVQALHRPSSLEELGTARRTLIYEELFYFQLSVLRRSAVRGTARRRERVFAGTLGSRLVERLPWNLTPDQVTALGEIEENLASAVPMSRLLQGEVGSGKTLVAFLACLLVIEAGEQCAFMAPTELLARQHAENAARLLEPIGVRIAYLSGNIKTEGRIALLEAMAGGEVDLVVGTHALFSENVVFANLGLVVVDEQHRFGVFQRAALMRKAEGSPPDLLLMTATPIPRTLALTAFGDLDISTIRTMPEGRLPVETHLARDGNEEKVYEWVEREIRKGKQAYFVYPLIQQSETVNLKDAEGMYERLKAEVFPEFRLGLIHSRLPEDTKRETMRNFVSGDLDILVATSVVEVGVDVPNATCMVVEHAERFGLSALHQLRGRVGRGSDQSYCFLVYAEPLTEEAKRRLKIMKDTSDGFRIAEEDLDIRGPGELTGFRQSGYLELGIADIVRDFDTLVSARDDVTEIIREDPGLLDPGNAPIRDVLGRVPPYPSDTLVGG